MLIEQKCIDSFDGAWHMSDMALIVFLRGINVGGHRRFRPSALPSRMPEYDVVNVGAAGTLVVRKPGTTAKFIAALRRQLPFDTRIAFCDSRDLIRLEAGNPFALEPSRADVIRFVSVLTQAARGTLPFPTLIPEGGQWLVRILGSRKRLVYGVYRRRMKAIGYLAQIDRVFGCAATTRSWSTILTVLRIVKADAGNAAVNPGGRSPGNSGTRRREF